MQDLELENKECGNEVKKRVQVEWRKVSGVICVKRDAAKLKGKIYKRLERPAVLYVLETK